MATECDPPGQPCILVIDDDADLVAFLFSVLVEERLSIVAASEGSRPWTCSNMACVLI
jgi:hypothetical protein